MHFYSSSNNAFYPAALRLNYLAAGTWPDDLIEITESEWQTYGQGQPPAGMQRGADDNGRPAWVPIPPKSLADLAAEKLASLEQALSTALATGMPYTMPDGTGEVVQTRPGDEPNLLGLAIEARDLRDAGETAAVLQLRVKSNVVYDLTPLQMIDLTDAAKRFKKQQLGKSWVLKDQVRGIVADEALTDDEKRAAIEAVSW